MLFGIGTDLTEVERIKSAVEKYGNRFTKRIFTQVEIDYCEQFRDKKFVHYAARFAVKESFSKAIGTGITQGFKFNEIGVVNEPGGKPLIILTGETLDKYGKYNTEVSISHTDTLAVAFVVMEEVTDETPSSIEIDFNSVAPSTEPEGE